jgi:diadenosine tetraphosphate (Ap4A) HIT family hydrolase
MVTPRECIFCQLAPDQVIVRNDLAVAIRDKFPVTKLHTLIIPLRHVESYFELTAEELASVHDLLRHCRDGIENDDATVGGFNVGANVGSTAGQKVPHVHVHLIPRRAGEAPPPPARA